MAFYEWTHDDRPNGKCLTVKELRELLAELPDDCQLVPNQVGNVAIYHGWPLGRQMCDGYIDFGTGEVSLSAPGVYGEVVPLPDTEPKPGVKTGLTPPGAP